MGQLRHADGRQHQHDPNCQQCDHADLEEGYEVVARSKQEPYRQDAGSKAVDDKTKGQLFLAEREHGPEAWVVVDCVASEQRDHQKHSTNGGHFQHFADAQVAHVQAHDHRKWHGHGGSDDAPRTLGQGVVHHQRKVGHQDD